MRYEEEDRDVCSFCGDPVGCTGRCTEAVEARIREFKENRDRPVHPSLLPVYSVVEVIQRGQLATYGALLAEEEEASE